MRRLIVLVLCGAVLLAGCGRTPRPALSPFSASPGEASEAGGEASPAPVSDEWAEQIAYLQYVQDTWAAWELAFADGELLESARSLPEARAVAQRIFDLCDAVDGFGTTPPMYEQIQDYMVQAAAGYRQGAEQWLSGLEEGTAAETGTYWEIGNRYLALALTDLDVAIKDNPYAQ